MRKILLLLFIFAFSFLRAQITITNSDMPVLNDTIRVSLTNTIGAMSPDSTGANYTWNFSSLVPASQDVEQFISTLSSGYPIFPFIASYGYKTNKIDTTNRIDFYKNGTSSYRQVGYGQKIGGFPVPVIYSPYDTIYRFPETFGKQDSCNSGYGFPLPGIGYYGQTQKRVNVCDGWGTLTTPYGTFQTLRVKSTLYKTDTLYIDTLHFGISFPLPTQIEYKWLGQAKKIPLLYILANDVFGFPVVTNVIYRDSLRPVPQVAVQELGARSLEFSVYPNPAHEVVFVSYTLEESAQVQMEVYDRTGKKVFDAVNRHETAGEHLEIIPLYAHALAPGIYFLNMRAEEKQANCKIMVQ
ncbi:MAG: T9SS type A sorting domain-containing protein [Bacteroidetes bacterium]|nr:T9SS type A sorting domain-containing protein [Bacteroidota bacterium]